MSEADMIWFTWVYEKQTGTTEIKQTSFVSLLCVFLETVYVFSVLFMSLFDCKCKSLNRLGENIQKQKDT